MTNKYYAGVGSRATPKEILGIMQTTALILAEHDYILRSGAADGADSSFEAGCDDGRGKKEIFLPWPKFNDHKSNFNRPCLKAQSLASTIHPNWSGLSSGARLLHSRNCYQILGIDLNSPVDFVICWTENGQAVGGTRTAIVLAEQHNIPVFNLAKLTCNELKMKLTPWLLKKNSIGP